MNFQNRELKFNSTDFLSERYTIKIGIKSLIKEGLHTFNGKKIISESFTKWTTKSPKFLQFKLTMIDEKNTMKCINNLQELFSKTQDSIHIKDFVEDYIDYEYKMFRAMVIKYFSEPMDTILNKF